MMKQGKAITVLAVLTAMILALPCMVMAGSLEPSAPPGRTMRTLDQVRAWITIDPRYESTVRFVDNSDGTILDRETGLTWAQDAYNCGKVTYNVAEFYCRQQPRGNRKGWRLPTVEEMSSLIDTSKITPPALPDGHPFGTGMLTPPWIFWTSTSYVGCDNCVWYVDLWNNDINAVLYDFKTSTHYFMMVRGGN